MTEHEEYVKLSWELLEMKFVYYKGIDSGLEPPPDAYYDEKERRYNYLCEKLGVEPTVSNMVGWDASRPSCKLVELKMLGKNREQVVRGWFDSQAAAKGDQLSLF